MERKVDFGDSLEERKKIVKKWQESGLLDGLKGHVKSNVTELFQSEDRLKEPENKPCEKLDEVVLPIVRRVFSQLPEGVDICGVHETTWVFGISPYQVDDDRIMF